jgi:hypothetical protein
VRCACVCILKDTQRGLVFGDTAAKGINLALALAMVDGGATCFL